MGGRKERQIFVKQKFKNNIETCLFLTMCLLLPVFTMEAAQIENDTYWFSLIMEPICAVFTISYLTVFLAIYRGERAGFGVFLKNFGSWAKWLLAGLWQFLWIFLWLLLFIIPGIVKAIAYSQYYFILAEFPKVDIKKALKLSETMMKGNKMLWLKRLLVFLPAIIIPELIAFIFYEDTLWVLLIPLICYLFLIPFMTLVFTDLYETLKMQALRDGRIQLSELGIAEHESIAEHTNATEEAVLENGFHKKGLIAFCVLTVLSVGLSAINAGGGSALIGGESLAVLDIRGTISENDGVTYNQQYLLDSVEEIKQDEGNKGILLRINSPGGAVYQIDELYLKLMEYKKETGRPIYAAIETQAASGGYYEACAADKIYANRNALIGSIGVFIGEFLDVSDLLDEIGVNVTFIKSAPNKTMGNIYQPLTEEQKGIYQSICDEMYGRFVAIVSKSRDLSEDKVRVLADGRIYSAKQAEHSGLIDGVETFDTTKNRMIQDLGYEDLSLNYYSYESPTGVLDMIGVENIKKLIGAFTGDESVGKEKAEPELPVPMMMYLP